MSDKIHYQCSHLDRFPENLSVLRKEQKRKFQKDLKTIKEL